LIASSKHPFAAAEAELLTAIGPSGAGLCDALFRAAKRQGQIWLMLDGFDEVAPQSVAIAIDRIKSWERELPYVVIAVLSRPIGYRSLEPEFGHARVRPLSVASQRELLGRWCSPPLAERAWALLDEPRSRLRAIIPNPLMLTLVAMLANERRTLPLNRVQLYENAIDLLLRRGHCADPRGVRDRIAARHILGQLSCVLQEGTEELWSENTLHNHLIALGSRDPTIRNLLEPWDSPADFLEDISRNSGLIGPHDGPREPWRYLHRSLREFLVAEALSKESDIAIDNRIAVLRNDNAGRWGEPIALLCGLASNPLALLHKIQSFNSDLALRAILNAEGIKPSDAAQFVHATGQSLQHLERIARIWVASKEHEDLERTRELLMLMVQPSLDIRDLAIVHLVMERVGLPPDRKAFFAGAFRPLPRGHSLPAMVRVPGGSFTMGLSAPEMKSPFDTPEKQETVESFEIAVTPTTESQYQQFASAFGLDWRPGQPSSDGPVLPAVNVTWWEAYLFSCWLGYALPTEVEWEYACRAGTTTTFCSGDTVADLDRVGWYKSNSGGHVHPVGEKQPNQFGLYDMHGNVWEWCSDPTGSSDDEIFGENYWCLLRGGSWFNEAQRARSADRGSWPAGKPYPMIGFRLVRR
jgi:formylglycine-generating enzyme required for sulfatase activity